MAIELYKNGGQLSIHLKPKGHLKKIPMIPGKYPVSTHRVSWERNKNKKQCLIFTPCKAQGGELFFLWKFRTPLALTLGSLISVKHLSRGFTLHTK
jgi:hypothetical protein